MTDFEFTPVEAEGSVERRAAAFFDNMGISELAYSQALEDAIGHALLPRPGAVPAGQVWVPVGPRNICGRIMAIAQDPTNPLVIYVGSAHGGLWRTIDGGDNWEHLGEDEHNFPVSVIAIPAQIPTVLYIGTGSLTSNRASGRGLFQVNVPGPRQPARFVRLVPAHPSGMAPSQVNDRPATRGAALRYTSIRMDPDDRNRFWVASQSGLWRCEMTPAPRFTLEFPAVLASGATPPPVPSTAPTGSYANYATDLLVAHDPRDRERVSDGGPFRYLVLYVAIHRNGVYRGRFDRSTGSTSWEKQLQVPNPAIPFGNTVIALCERVPNRLYALMDDTTGKPTPVYRSDDNGENWRIASPTPGPGQTQASYNLVLEVNPTDPDILCAGLLDVFLSRDGGASWRKILVWQDYNDIGDYAQHADQHAAFFDRFDRRKLWIGNDGGLAVSRNLSLLPRSPKFWRARSHGIAAGQFQDVSVHPTPALSMLCGGGLQDNGSWICYGGPTWIHVGWADGGYIAFDGANPRRYVVSQDFDHTAYNVTLANTAPGIVNKIVNDLPENLAPLNAMGFSGGNLPGFGFAPGASPFVPVVVQNPARPADLLLGWRRAAGLAAAFSSVNSGVSSLPLAGLPAAVPPPNAEGTAACFAPTIVPGGNVDGWVGFSNGMLARTANAPAGNWAQPAAALPFPGGVNQLVSRIVVHPTDERIVVVCTVGTPAALISQGRVFITYDRGTTWQDLTARAPANIAITPPAPSIPTGQKQQFKAQANFADGTSFDATTSATWTSSDPTKAQFSPKGGEEGQLGTIAAGLTTVSASLTTVGAATVANTAVTVTAGGGGAPAVLPVPARDFDRSAVPPGPMTSLEFDQTTPTRLFVGTLAGVYVLNNVPSPVALNVTSPSPLNLPNGHTAQLRASCTFNDGTVTDVTTQVDWSAAPGGIVNFVAVVPSQLTGAAVGATTVTARRGTLTANVAVSITAPVAPVPPAPAPPAAAVAPVVRVRWRPFNAGLPLTLVNDITHISGTNILRLATFGRGIWDCNLTPPATAQRLFIRQTIIEDGRTYPRVIPAGLPDDPRLPAGTVGLDFTHAFDIRVDAPPFRFFDDHVDGVEFDEELGADTLAPFAPNAIYVQTHNGGREAATNVTLHLYFRAAPGPAPFVPPPGTPIPNAAAANLGTVAEFYGATFDPPGGGSPASGATWTRVGPARTLPRIAPGQPVVTRFDWQPPPGLAGKDVALLALCTSPPGQDPLPNAAVAGPGIDLFVPAERRAALRIVTVGAPPLADLFIRGGIDDDGLRIGGVASNLRSPDIIVTQTAPANPEVAFRDLLDLRPQDHFVAGQANKIYVRGHNRGAVATTAEVEVWGVKIKADLTPDFAPGNWVRISPAAPDKLQIDNIPPHGAKLGELTWTPDDPSPGEPYKTFIIVALIKSADGNDPLPATAGIDSADKLSQFLDRQAGSDNVAARALRVRL